MGKVSALTAATAVTADDTFYVIDGATSKKVSAALVKQYVTPVINVKDVAYGAVGDGVTNDTAAFVAALAVGVGDVLVPPGTYIVNDLAVSTSRRLVGIGKPILRSDDNAAEAVVILTGDRAAIVGCKVDADTLASYCVEVTGANTVIEDCELYDPGVDGVLVYNGGCRVEGNEIRNFPRYGVKVETLTPCVIVNNSIHDAVDGNGVQVTGQFVGTYAAHGHQITGNHIYNIASTTGSGASGNGVLIYNAGDCSITGNTIHDVEYSWMRGSGARRCSFDGNVCRTAGETGVFIEFAWRDISVTGNHLHDAASSGVAFTNANDASEGRGGVCSGNVITGVATDYGIFAEAACAITGNHVDIGGLAGILLGYGGAWDLTVTGNRITDSQATPTLLVGIAAENYHGGGDVFARVPVSGNVVSAATLANYGGHDYSDVTNGAVAWAWPSYPVLDHGTRTGTGTPESAVTAPVGTLYLRTDGGASTTLYIKESGTGNTGWVAK